MEIHPEPGGESISVMKKRRLHYYMLVSCFCPCFVLGESETFFVKEKGCISKNMGSKGFETCMCTSLLCICCWPFSPFLGCYIRAMDRHMKTRYGFVLPQNEGWLKYLSDVCCWRHTVSHHMTTLRHKVPYFDLVDSSLMTTPPSPTATTNQSYFVYSDAADTAVVMVGASGVGKTELLMKLSCTRIENYGEPTFDSQQVRVGLKKVPHKWLPSKGPKEQQQASDIAAASAFSEIWDIPHSQLDTIRHVSAPVTHVLLVFDATRPETLDELKVIFQEVCCLPVLNGVSYICVAAKDDYLFLSCTEEAKDIPDPCEHAMNSGARWAHTMGFTFIPTAARYTLGIRELQKAINKQVGVSVDRGLLSASHTSSRVQLPPT